jgi:hypothetical protein
MTEKETLPISTGKIEIYAAFPEVFELRLEGFEPSTCGLGNRCSIP